MAEKVMRMPINDQPFFSPKPAGISKVQRKCTHCDDEEKLQRKENSSQPFQASNETSSYIYSLSLKGSPLSKETRSFFEPRLGYDFSKVKIHNDYEAAKSAQSINALAYTAGNNIVFNQNQFAPENESGKKLLAHELTHVVQQRELMNTLQRKCAPPSLLVSSAGIPGLGNFSSMVGDVAEDLIIGDYCKNGCAPMVTEFFDTRAGGSSAYIAFLIAHNLRLNPAQMALLAISNGFQRPDILVDRGSQKELYEIKPRSIVGINDGLDKIDNLEAFMAVFSLPYIVGTTYVPSNPIISRTVNILGIQVTISLEANLNIPGLITYEFCFDVDLPSRLLLLALIAGLAPNSARIMNVLDSLKKILGITVVLGAGGAAIIALTSGGAAATGASAAAAVTDAEESSPGFFESAWEGLKSLTANVATEAEADFGAVE